MKIDFITIFTNDLKASVDFYANNLNFEVERKFSPAPGIDIVFLNDKHGNKIEFIQNEKEKPFSGHGISIGFYVDDIRVVEKNLREKGIQILRGPIEMKSGVTMLYIKDNNGLELAFVQEK